MADIQRPRGTRDFRPEDMEIRRSAEGMMRRSFELAGYREVATPVFEHAELFVAKSGPQVLDQMYVFRDKGGREIALRPELTAPVMRFYSSDLKNYPKPIRIYYFGNCFRYERPQKGRFREFWQLGLEYIGKRTPLAVAEVITAAVTALISVGLSDFQVRVGHVALLSALLAGWNIDPGRDKDLMIAIDKKDAESVKKLIRGRSDRDPAELVDLITSIYDPDEAVRILDRMAGESGGSVTDPVGEMKEVMALLAEYGDMIKFDPSITRGLDYYDGSVFEIDAPSLGAEKQICGGGSYSLSAALGRDVEGIGFGIGFDRIILALGDRDPGKKKARARFYLVTMDAGAEALSLASRIRKRDFECILETSNRSFKKAINFALERGCRYLLILGENEVRSGTFAVKDLEKGEQISMRLEDLDEYLDRL
ncbi:MAG: histidine--tRNA ligase [Thermoplasmatota archaeon]